MQYYPNYNDFYTYGSNFRVISAVGLIVAFIASILVYALFLKKENRGKFSGFLGFLYEFLNFRRLSLEVILKITYLFFAIWLTISSFEFISTSFLMFLAILIFGNIALRLSYELIMLTIAIWRNTKDINDKLGMRIGKGMGRGCHGGHGNGGHGHNHNEGGCHGHSEKADEGQSVENTQSADVTSEEVSNGAVEVPSATDEMHDGERPEENPISINPFADK